MHLRRITVQGIRNLQNQTHHFLPTVNVFSGANASGKSSLLEALHILGTGRSFRSRRFQDIIQYEQRECLVAGLLEIEQQTVPLGYQRKGSDVELHVNRKRVSKSSYLAQQFPLRIIHPESDELISGSPGIRRRFLDWGVFHVEHGFHKAWQTYNHTLKQRNAALKAKQTDQQITLWDRALAESGFAMHSYRSNYLEHLLNNVAELQPSLFTDTELSIEYKPGWDTAEDLELLLHRNMQKDKRFGFTSIGPHKADLRILSNGHLAAEHVSRGQLKNVVVLLTLAQIQTHYQQTGKNCALLFDDLASELDAERRNKVFTTLAGLHTQLFLTCIETQGLDLRVFTEGLKMFHVEQGQITELD